MTTFDKLDAATGRFQLVTQLPSTPAAYYGSYGISSDEWRGGEIVYHNGSGTGSDKLYIQLATSGKTAEWRTITTQFTAA